MASRAQRSANAKAARKSAVVSGSTWEPPPLAECEEKTVLVEPDSTNRIIMRRVLHNSQLVAYAVTHVTLVGPDKWEEVSSIDTNHGCVHLHLGANHARATEFGAIDTQIDVQSSFNDSYDHVYDNYENFKDKQ
jgi:hypothetical protein